MTEDKRKPENDDPVIDKKSHPVPTPGPHEALIADVKNMGMFEFGGDKKQRWALVLELDERDVNGEPILQYVFFSLTIEPKSRLLTILTELRIDPGEHFRPKSLIAVRCGVVTKLVKKDNGKMQSEVASFYRLKDVTAKTALFPGKDDNDEIVVRKSQPPEDPTTITDRDVPF